MDHTEGVMLVLGVTIMIVVRVRVRDWIRFGVRVKG